MRLPVISYIKDGGSKADAGRIFNVSRNTLYRWLRLDDLTPKKHGPRKRKIDKDALRQHVQDHPDMFLRERAAVFGVDPSAISYALKKMRIVKKTSAVQRAMQYEKASVLAKAKK